MADYSHFTQTYVRQCMDYDPATGALVWRHRPKDHFKSSGIWKSWNGKHAGKPALNAFVGAGRQRLGGRLNGISCLSHRIIWLWVHGVWPDQIDHIDGNPQNNSLVNLRSCSLHENMRNLPILKTNRSGCTGVSWCTSSKKWRARIASRPGSMKFLGNFSTFGEAVSARKSAENQIGYHPNHGRRA